LLLEATVFLCSPDIFANKAQQILTPGFSLGFGFFHRAAKEPNCHNARSAKKV